MARSLRNRRTDKLLAAALIFVTLLCGCASEKTMQRVEDVEENAEERREVRHVDVRLDSVIEQLTAQFDSVVIEVRRADEVPNSHNEDVVRLVGFGATFKVDREIRSMQTDSVTAEATRSTERYRTAEEKETAASTRVYKPYSVTAIIACLAVLAVIASVAVSKRRP